MVFQQYHLLLLKRGMNMGIFKTVKTLSKIDKECESDAELKKRLEPWVIKMNTAKPSTKKEALELSEKFIAEYHRIKSDIERSVDETGSLRKIEQVNER